MLLIGLALLLSLALYVERGYAEVVFTYATGQTTSTADPAYHRDETESMDIVNLYDPLLYPQKGGAPKPHVAESWDVSADGLTWTFHLRKGIKFHDGSELTAEDVVFSMDRELRLGKGYSWLWATALKPGSTKALDRHTVQFRLNAPYGPFIATLIQFFIVNKKVVLAHKEAGDYGEFGDYGVRYLSRHDAGSGPFILESVIPDTRRIYRRFPGYWQRWKPNQVDKVVIEIVPEPATMKTLLKAGKIDMSDQWKDREWFESARNMEGVTVQEDPNNQLYLIHINNKKPPLDNINVRKAILHAFDYRTAVEVIFGNAKRARGPVPVGLAGHNDKVKVYETDLAKAKEYMKKAGVKPKRKFIYSYTTAGVNEKMGLLLQSNLAEIGIDVELKPNTWATLVQMVSKPETTPDFFPVFHTAKYPSPDGHTYLMYHPNAWGTYMSASWYQNPEMSRLMEEARKTADTEKRYELYKKAQEIVVNDAASLWIANPMHRIAYRNRVKGYTFTG
ncbi:MAG: ABC transporter substrate-binding protein, partial [Nitrospinota bacterium]